MFTFYHVVLVGGVAADSVVAVRAPPSPAETVQDHAAVVEVHAAGVRGAVVFVLDPAGIALLLKVPPDASWAHVAWIAVTAIAGIAILAAGVQGWLLRTCTRVERGALIAGGLLLVYSAPLTDWIGLALAGAVLAWQKLGRKPAPAELRDRCARLDGEASVDSARGTACPRETG